MNKTGPISTLVLIIAVICSSHGQRITTIQLDGVQYFVSRMNPYAPELNYFLAYQYCRSLGLQLVSFETREKADSITEYLSNAGYSKFDFWTSGNKLGTDMSLWMSTGLPFNATFNYMKKQGNDVSNDQLIADIPSGSTSPQRTARESGNNDSTDGCVALKGPSFSWDTDDCMAVKDFICEQTRCYYYNYGSIPVSSAQGKPHFTTTLSPSTTTTQGSQPSVNLGINDFINKVYTKVSYGSSTTSKLHVSKDSENNDEVVTNGPYDSDVSVNAELHDDPSVIADHSADEDYVSTIEPEGATSIPTS